MAEGAASFDAAHVAVLEQMATGTPLPAVLEAIVRMIERRSTGMICSIQIVDQAHGCLRLGAAPCLPPEFARHLDGFPIGPDEGSCGAAVFRKKHVIVEDIATHPNWTRYRQLTLPHGLRACWSSPIFSPEREVLGTFAMYYREVRGPSAQELGWVGTATHLAAIALVRDRAERSLRLSEARAQQLAQLHAVSSSVSEALVRCRDPQQLYDIACRIAVEKGLAALAWVGVYHPDGDRIEPLSRYGKDQGYVDAIVLRIGDDRIARGPAAKAIATGEVSISNDIESDPDFHWKGEAIPRGLRSCAAFPLKLGEGAPGVLIIYGEAPGFFRAEEIRVLGAVADNISIAIEAAHNEAERRRLVGALGERVKELTLLHRTSRLLELERPVDGSLLADLVALIPSAWQHPELCEARIRWAGIEASTARFRETPWSLSAALTAGADHGTIEVVYLQAPPSDGEDPFFPEERELIRSLADSLASYFGRSQAEAKLRQVQKMEAVGQLAGGVAHDFNNLLSIILSYTALLLDDLKPGDAMRADLEEIGQAGERAAELSRQLLAFSRQQLLQPRVIDLNQIVSGLERMLRRLIGEHIEVSIVLAPALGQVLADPGQVEQVLMNLVLNARDAMPEGGTLTVETDNVVLEEAFVAAHDGAAVGPHVMLAVTDTGQGMDPATLARAFEPFFTTKGPAKGTGLGLATVYGIVKQSGATLATSTAPGRGTAMKVYFPCVDAPLDVVAVPKDAALVGSETILVVEDVAQVRAIVKAILRRAGYHVLDAEGGEEALTLCQRHQAGIDLLLTDVVMPRMGGRELAERAQKVRPEMRVLFMSGYAEDAIAQHGVIDARISFLPKPIRPDALLRKVRAVLDGNVA